MEVKPSSAAFCFIYASPLHQEDIRLAFLNISKIMDCVDCFKCRLWGKLQVGQEEHFHPCFINSIHFSTLIFSLAKSVFKSNLNFVAQLRIVIVNHIVIALCFLSLSPSCH